MNARASIFKTVDTQHVFNIMSRPQLIEAARSLISEFEDCFVLLGVRPSSNCQG